MYRIAALASIVAVIGVAYSATADAGTPHYLIVKKAETRSARQGQLNHVSAAGYTLVAAGGREYVFVGP
jgi:hypothetical protein